MRGVLDLDPGDFAAADLNRQRQPLEQREVDVHVEQVSLEAGQAIGDRDQLLPQRVQILQPFL